MVSKKLYIIAYDIHKNKSRLKVSKILEKYGKRINLSVFECILSSLEKDNIIHQIDLLINKKTDQVHIYNICQECYSKSISIPFKNNISPIIKII